MSTPTLGFSCCCRGVHGIGNQRETPASRPPLNLQLKWRREACEDKMLLWCKWACASPGFHLQPESRVWIELPAAALFFDWNSLLSQDQLHALYKLKECAWGTSGHLCIVEEVVCNGFHLFPLFFLPHEIIGCHACSQTLYKKKNKV